MLGGVGRFYPPSLKEILSPIGCPPPAAPHPQGLVNPDVSSWAGIVNHPRALSNLEGGSNLTGGLRMDTSHELAPPLTDLLYAMAEEGADAETTNLQEDVWAGLLRDGADVARRLTEQID